MAICANHAFAIPTAAAKLGGVVAETTNIAEIAARLSRDIFKHFLWATHPKTDDNFECTNDKHVADGEKPKATHPGDVRSEEHTSELQSH